VAFLIIWYWPIKEPKEEPTATEDVVIDPFADGFPVPPLPGQVLPPSPRSAGQAITVPVDTVTLPVVAASEEEA
ncbi:MAG: hypothetical protein LBH68_08640, partial [Bifidobacteriaceae bacterium]|jgi:NADH-quinone oxidoreductase subunit H|nr:hypothetical protein [Bifidobacteriaceae bacterium]